MSRKIIFSLAILLFSTLITFPSWGTDNRYRIAVLPFDDGCAKEFGRLRGVLKRKGIVVSPIDLMIASVALAHDLTLVTHNTADFRPIPDLRLDDWLE